MKKLTKAKPNLEHFIKETKQYGPTLDKIKNKKARMKLFVSLNCCNFTPNCLTLHILMNVYLFCTCCELYMIYNIYITMNHFCIKKYCPQICFLEQ